MVELDLSEFRDLQLDEEEILAFYDAFNLFDENGDQTISISELGTVMKALGKEVPDEQLRAMMASVDMNGDDSIDFKEFL
mmetsp:Transcript_3777/g.5047  ORF Transcript_3777/g.5047 Transcript_3777/m.5047 type:complete len:80 (+) Transcript_3777:14-253(+)